jgi:hypothetical protein
MSNAVKGDLINIDRQPTSLQKLAYYLELRKKGYPVDYDINEMQKNLKITQTVVCEHCKKETRKRNTRQIDVITDRFRGYFYTSHACKKHKIFEIDIDETEEEED